MDIFLVFLYCIMLVIGGLIIGCSYNVKSSIVKIAKIAFVLAAIGMCICVLTGCMLVKCDNCTFYEQPDKIELQKAKK